ncbi:MAG: hypothetical protein A3F16_06535 [Deltaproteobacteria bacterium RIFCSPHIGHO2_12_FULL_43_9]|nr:MAG: hypothetical protein A3F16_06535 [Deltaproteobacteria bacterium RIFCSPHIGHO2_12_FULL_43_9]
MVDIVIRILEETWNIYFESAVYVIFGFVISGILYAWISPKDVSRHLGKPNFLSVLKATLLGLPLPLCSCGAVPAALHLRQRKASKGSTLAFLISTPETGVDSIAISYALLGPIYTIVRPIAAIVTAIITGIVANICLPAEVEPTGQEEPARCQICSILPGGNGCPHTFWDRIRAAFRFSFGEFLHELSKWLLIGFLAAGIISAAIPTSFLQNYLGSGLPAMLILLAIGIPIYICASSSTPIAAALLLKGVGPGAVLVFLLAGPATNVATFTMVGKFIGKRALFIYLICISLVSLMCGILFESFLSALQIDIRSFVYAGGELMPSLIKWVGALIFAPILLYSVTRDLIKKKSCNDCKSKD